jgi:hypothetical protein
MRERILLSVVVPIWAENLNFKRFIDSFKTQDTIGVELIVIKKNDYDLNDTTQKELQKYNCIIDNVSELNLGRIKNKATGIASGEYLWFCSASTILEDGAISVLLKRLRDIECDVLLFEYQDAKDSVCFFTQKACLDPLIKEGEYLSMDVLGWIFDGSINPTTCNKLYSLKLLKSRKGNFLEGNYYEDIVADISLICESDKVHILKENLFSWDKSFLSEKLESGQRIDAFFKMLCEIRNIMLRNNLQRDTFLTRFASFFWKEILLFYRFYIESSSDELNGLFLEKLNILTADLPLFYYRPKLVNGKSYYLFMDLIQPFIQQLVQKKDLVQDEDISDLLLTINVPFEVLDNDIAS